MIQNAEKYKKDDIAQKEKIDARNRLERLCYDTFTTTNIESWNLSADDKEKLEKKKKEILDWLNENNELVETTEYEKRIKEMEQLFQSFMNNTNNNNNNNHHHSSPNNTTTTNTTDELD